ncbi:hypothetical protein WN55_11328 [Dufourea novaeangliae]|uniref:Uncharacterized protein n=1 Tax=Dufourea novaeangliae TaxID=178035 RepID=A0A154PAA1_DUFNO|nr:hypothetical protein WN55_11328 [Dufourea novaeangliae]
MDNVELEEYFIFIQCSRLKEIGTLETSSASLEQFRLYKNKNSRPFLEDSKTVSAYYLTTEISIHLTGI